MANGDDIKADEEAPDVHAAASGDEPVTELGGAASNEAGEPMVTPMAPKDPSQETAVTTGEETESDAGGPTEGGGESEDAADDEADSADDDMKTDAAEAPAESAVVEEGSESPQA